MANVLVIEPNVALARTYVQALQHVGHDVTHVCSAQDAIDAADHTHPDVVVLELQLAVHDGVEFLHEFRSYAEWHNTPVIINTSLEKNIFNAVQGTLAGDLGVVQVLYKPRTTLEQLLSSVKQHIVAA
jgi:CheY-like chemotaxis protein